MHLCWLCSWEWKCGLWMLAHRSCFKTFSLWLWVIIMVRTVSWPAYPLCTGSSIIVVLVHPTLYDLRCCKLKGKHCHQSALWWKHALWCHNYVHHIDRRHAISDCLAKIVIGLVTAITFHQHILLMLKDPSFGLCFLDPAFTQVH